MGNLVANLKRFFANKNTVTILGVIAGVAVLYIGYNYRVKQDTALLRIPCAAKEISGQSQISLDDVKYVEMPAKVVNDLNIFRNGNEIEGLYINVGTSIPEGGFFFKSQVVDKDGLPASIFDGIENGQTIYSLAVDNHTTYGNSILPKSKIDLFLKATDENGRLIFGKFIESIEVLAVRDSGGNDVFSSTEPGTPSELLFAVPDDMYSLMFAAEAISGIEIIPVPRNANYTSDDLDTVTTDELKAFILSKTGIIN